jgi:hypothetical protein
MKNPPPVNSNQYPTAYFGRIQPEIEIDGRRQATTEDQERPSSSNQYEIVARTDPNVKMDIELGCKAESIVDDVLSAMFSGHGGCDYQEHLISEQYTIKVLRHTSHGQQHSILLADHAERLVGTTTGQNLWEKELMQKQPYEIL